MSIQNLYDTTCSLYTQGHTTNQIGEHVLTKTLLASSVPCRLMRLSGKNIIYMDNIATYLDVKIFLDSRSDIEEWDYITVNGIEYKVYDFYNVHGYSSGHHVEARCYIEDRK